MITDVPAQVKPALHQEQTLPTPAVHAGRLGHKHWVDWTTATMAGGKLLRERRFEWKLWRKTMNTVILLISFFNYR